MARKNKRQMICEGLMVNTRVQVAGIDENGKTLEFAKVDEPEDLELVSE